MTLLDIASGNTVPNTTARERPASAGYFDLSEEIDWLKSGAQYMASGHAARTLVRSSEFRVVLIVLQNGAELKEHKTDHPVSIQTLEGSIRITRSARALEQTVGGLLVIEPGAVHDVLALADSAFLLSIPWAEHTED